MKLDFIYKYGYNHASAFVHPMATDGLNDFYRLMDIPTINIGADPRSILQNACFSVIFLIREALNNSSLIWKEIVYFFLDNIMKRTYLLDSSDHNM